MSLRPEGEVQDKATIDVTLVSAQGMIYEGRASSIAAPGTLGELGILPGHSALLSMLKPGEVRIATPDDELLMIYVSGGMLEVQPHTVTVLADTAIRAEEIDREEAEKARKRAEIILDSSGSMIDLVRASLELDQAIALIRIHEHALHNKRRHLKSEEKTPIPQPDKPTRK